MKEAIDEEYTAEEIRKLVVPQHGCLLEAPQTHFDSAWTILAPTCRWDGYICTFATREGILSLDRIDFFILSDLSPLFGRPPERLPPETRILDDFNIGFTHLSKPIAFTGGLLIGREEPEDLNPRWAIPGVWTSLISPNPLVDHGRITAALDHSQAFASLRAWIKAQLVAHRCSGPELRTRTNAITQKAYFDY